MKHVWFSAVFGTAMVALPSQAAVQVSIDLTTQRMNVRSSTGTYSWPVSTARAGYVTPRGSFAPYSLQRMHYSRAYGMAPMPHSIFFRGGYAIHGTGATGALGQPASHGCIRLAPGNAAALYSMVSREGARISISGSPPASRAVVASRVRAMPKFAPMAYATRPGTVGVRAWQRNPTRW